MIVREGMVNLISWKDYDIEIVGSAWNGLEGYEIIKETHPDIVLTDIKMPVLNGIDLIRKTREDFSDIIFVVLSGYGEFEYTSQAMELGVKYYILKPCDEEKITKVINQAKDEITLKRIHKRYENDRYNKEIKELLPHAKEQFFRNVLQNEVVSEKDFRFYMNTCVKKDEKVRLLVFRVQGEFDFIGRFVALNILEELLGGQSILLNTNIDEDVIVLISDINLYTANQIVEKLKAEYIKFDKRQIVTAISKPGVFSDIKEMYYQIQILLLSGSYQGHKSLIAESLDNDLGNKASFLVDFENMNKVKDLNSFLLELTVVFIKCKINNFQREDMLQLCGLMIYALLKQDDILIQEDLEKCNTEVDMYLYLSKVILKHKKFTQDSSNSKNRMEQILIAVYENIHQRNLNIQWLAKDILFINEDYLGRTFSKHMKQKFSVFITNTRMEIAIRLLQYNSELLISELAELVGYASDAQYFCKVFKSYVQMTPSEYRDNVNNYM